jgi:NAD(P)-dependent dehydrogenase (short-subunit alcohol dehydrogenase family)
MSPTAAVVTGAASGLGLAVVRALTADGAEVVGVDLPGDDRAGLVVDAGATFLACDVTSADEWTTVADGVGARLGRVDLLALNAGVMTRSPRDPVDDDPLDLVGSPGYRRVFAVNVDGVVLGLAALRPLLAPGASVVVTASQAGLSGLPFDPYYAMTKHAVVGFVRSMAPRLAGAEVRINALCPGGIDTAIVPDPLRATVPAEAFRPPELVARSLLDVAGQATTGGTWLPADDGTARLYTVPPLH